MKNARISFDEYYRDLFGGRWDSLREALLSPPTSIPFDGGGVLKKPYFMDRASVLAASSLPLPDKGLVLDACAAPGGKSLVLASGLAREARLFSNELSAQRRRRMVNVFDGHLGSEVRNKVEVSAFDAAAEGGKPGSRGRFDAILLDAPCSSERHVIRDKSALAAWTPSRPKFLAGRQWALLSSCFLMLRENAFLVYATCSLCSAENDGVAERLVKKYGGNLECVPPNFTEGEKTAYGRIILPDASGGMGPMYVAFFRKKPAAC